MIKRVAQRPNQGETFTTQPGLTTRTLMAKQRVFTSFDFDHDEDLRNLLVGQAKHPDSPFELADWSLRQPFTGDWKEKVRTRIRRVQQMIVLCGQYTHNAVGVGWEVRIAQEEQVPYFCLRGRGNVRCTFPTSARKTDKMYTWTWDNLRLLLAQRR